MNHGVLVNDALALGRAVERREPETPELGMIDDQSFQVLYSRTAVALRAYAARVLGNSTYADDIVQETYLRLVRSAPSTRDPDQLRAWLFRIASRLIVDHWRRGRLERGMPDQSAATGGTPGPDIPLRLDMARVLEQLSPQQRQLMWLAYVEGADHREIAAALGLRARSVRVLLLRARRKLRGCSVRATAGLMVVTSKEHGDDHDVEPILRQ